MPRWLEPDVWDALVRYWQDPKAQVRSTNGRNARMSDPNGHGIHKHRSGQKSFKRRGREQVSYLFSKMIHFMISTYNFYLLSLTKSVIFRERGPVSLPPIL